MRKQTKPQRQIVAYDDDGEPIFGTLFTTGRPRKKSKPAGKRKETSAEFRRRKLAEVGIYWG